MTTYPDLKLYIGGAWRKTAEQQPVLDPADESVIGAMPLASQTDLDEGLKVWSRTAPRIRAEIMIKAAALMREPVEDITEGIETGNISINTLEASVAELPFGGVKDSGYGREGGTEGLAHHMTVKTLSLRMVI